MREMHPTACAVKREIAGLPAEPAKDSAEGFLTHSDRMLILLGGLILLVYIPVINADFVNWDDPVFTSENGFVASGITLRGLQWALATGLNGMWHPLTWLSLMFDGQVSSGLTPAVFHLTNLWLHIVNTILLFYILRPLLPQLWTRGFACALFALHPINVETVAWVAERKGVLFGTTLFLTLLAYRRYLSHPGWKSYAVVVVLHVLGLASKSTAVVTPFLLLVLDYTPGYRSADMTWLSVRLRSKSLSYAVTVLLEKVPLLIVSVVGALLTLQTEAGAGAIHSVGMAERVANIQAAYVGYLRNFLFPSGLNALYARPDLLKPAIAALHLISLSAVVFTIYKLRTRYPAVVMAFLWYAIAILPVSGIVPYASHFMADRYAYTSLIGFIVVAAVGFDRMVANQRLRMVAQFSVILVAMVISSKQVGHWKDSDSLWRRILEHEAENSIASNNLASDLIERGLLVEAQHHLQLSLHHRPNNPQAYINLADIARKQRRPARELAYCRAAIQHCQPNAEHFTRLGDALRRGGDEVSAYARYQQALVVNRNEPVAHEALALLMLTSRDPRLRDTSKAVVHAASARSLRNNFENTYLETLLMRRLRQAHARQQP